MSSNLYDKQKAHEYYMKRRQLKGRHSTKGMSEGQKEQFSYAKHVLGEERKERDQTNKENIKNEKERKREDLRKLTQARVKALKVALKNMTPYQRKLAKQRIESAIKNLKAYQSKKNKDISMVGSAKLQSAKAASKEKYEKDVDTAYNKIKGK